MASIIVSRDEHVATIIFNRPEVFNSFNKELALQFQKILDECEKDTAVRCIVITGSGKAFCAGQDLNEVTDPEGPPLQKIVADHYNPIIERLRNIEKPIVAAVNGAAAGAGANIALACDLVVAKHSAFFMQAFSKIGLIPDSGGTFILPRLVGLQRAAAMAMLAEKTSAETAEQIGLIYKAIPDDEFDQFVRNLASRLSAMPTTGLGLIKRAFNASLTNDLSNQLAIEEQLQFAASNTHDYEEGVAAFLEKRKPEFTGE